MVGHVKDTTMEDSDDGGDNLVAHIRVSPSYHLRKEVQHVIAVTVQLEYLIINICTVLTSNLLSYRK